MKPVARGNFVVDYLKTVQAISQDRHSVEFVQLQLSKFSCLVVVACYVTLYLTPQDNRFVRASLFDGVGFYTSVSLIKLEVALAFSNYYPFANSLYIKFAQNKWIVAIVKQILTNRNDQFVFNKPNNIWKRTMQTYAVFQTSSIGTGKFPVWICSCL